MKLINMPTNINKTIFVIHAWKELKCRNGAIDRIIPREISNNWPQNIRKSTPEKNHQNFYNS